MCFIYRPPLLQKDSEEELFRSVSWSTANELNTIESLNTDTCTQINNETSGDEEETIEDVKSLDWVVVAYTGN